MSGGKDAALDIVWGRGGGRRKAGPGHPAGLIAELDEMRRQRESLPKDDPPCGRLGCLLKISEHLPLCRLCGTFVEHHAPGDEELEWEGHARMALARAGRHTPDDVEALYRFPEPRSWVSTPPPEGLLAAFERHRLRVAS